MHYILGVDAGGTKCEALLMQPDGVVAGWGRCVAHATTRDDDATFRATGEGGGRSLAAVQSAVSQAIGNTPVSSLHIVNTGNGFSARRMLPNGFDCRTTLRQVVESHTVFCLAPTRAALVALTGTGSHVAGRGPRGRIITLDGLGPYIGDYGGAVAIGLEGLRAAARSDWHPRHRTSLADALLDEVKKIEPYRRDLNLVSFMYFRPDRWKVAALAQWVDQEAEAGDAIAQRIIRQAADNMAEVVFDLLEKLELRAAQLPLIGFGSVTASRGYWRRFCEAVHVFAPGVRPSRLLLPPAACHALNAVSTTPDFPAIRRNLCETLGPFLGKDIPAEVENFVTTIAALKERQVV